MVHQNIVDAVHLPGRLPAEAPHRRRQVGQAVPNQQHEPGKQEILKQDVRKGQRLKIRPHGFFRCRDIVIPAFVNHIA